MTIVLPVAEEITVGLVEQAARDLERLQERTGLSRTDLVNRAVSFYAFADSQVGAGSEILVRDKAGSEQSVHLL